MPLPLLAIPLIGGSAALVVFGIHVFTSGDDPSEELLEALLEQVPEQFRGYVSTVKTDTEMIIEVTDDAPTEIVDELRKNVELLGKAETRVFDTFALVFHGSAEAEERHICTIALKEATSTVGRLIVINPQNGKLPKDRMNENSKLISMHLHVESLDRVLEQLQTNARTKRIVFVEPDRASLEFLY